MRRRQQASAAPASEAIVVKIGHAAPLTGGIAHLGKDNENGARLAVEEINEEGLTIDGHKIDLQLDARGRRRRSAKPEPPSRRSWWTITVVAVVGHLNSGVSIRRRRSTAMRASCRSRRRRRTPTYTQQGFKTTYRVVATDAQQGPALGQLRARRRWAPRRVAVVDDATAYGKGLADEFAKTAEANGAKVVAREATNDRATDFRAILTKIKSKQPDVIMFGGMDATRRAVRQTGGGAGYQPRRSWAATACDRQGR